MASREKWIFGKKIYHLKMLLEFPVFLAIRKLQRKIGTIKMKEYLEKFEYKNMIFDSLTIDNFWLEGNSKISQNNKSTF